MAVAKGHLEKQVYFCIKREGVTVVPLWTHCYILRTKIYDFHHSFAPLVVVYPQEIQKILLYFGNVLSGIFFYFKEKTKCG